MRRKGPMMSHLAMSFEATLKTVGHQMFFQAHTYSEAALCCIVYMLDEFHRTVKRAWS